ncbi:MAG: hypothetical protein EA360_10975 [Balneolaceae bacterium]|nr:MAG: hypothetical protein EA360_10975 [Balneolaceae bacterium]
MNWIVNIIFVLSAILAFYRGQHPGFSFERLTKTTVLNSILGVLLFFTLLMVLHFLGFFPQFIAAPFMIVLYSLIAGFFGGYAWRLYRLRRKMGNLLYQHRTFWTDHAPAIFAVLLIIYGLFRTALLTDQFITGIRITSGLSLMAFGLVIWMLKTVPEFRSWGILLLDKEIGWQTVVSWSWESESVISIEYLGTRKNSEGRIRQFYTSVPEEDRRELELILKSKMEEYSEERKDILFPDNDNETELT